MRDIQVPVMIEKEPEDPGYLAYSPALPGCFSNGMTIEETERNMREAIELHVSCMIEAGQPLPPELDTLKARELTVSLR